MMEQVGSAFFRSDKTKCPNCGEFSEDGEEARKCPGCETVFNEYIILQQGEEASLQNN